MRKRILRAIHSKKGKKVRKHIYISTRVGILIALIIFAALFAIKQFVFRSQANTASGVYTSLMGRTTEGAAFQAKPIPLDLLDTRIYAPQFIKNYDGYNSFIYVINPHNSNTSITVTFVSDKDDVKTDRYTLAPWQLWTISSDKLKEIPNRRNYGVEITGSQPIAGIIYNENGKKDVFVSHLVPKKLAGRMNFQQKVYAGYQNKNSGHALLNTSEHQINVKITVRFDGGAIAKEVNYMIPPKHPLFLYAPDFMNSVPSFRSGDLTATVENSSTGDELVGSYQITQRGDSIDTMSSVGTSEKEASRCQIIFPVQYGTNNLISNFTVQNAETTPLSLLRSDGYQITFLAPYPAGAQTVTSIEIPQLLSGHSQLQQGETQEHALGTFLNAGLFSNYTNKVFAAQVCANVNFTTLVNTGAKNSASSLNNNFAFGDSGYGDVWKENEFAVIFMHQPFQEEGIHIFNPEGNRSVTVSIYDSNGYFYGNKNFVVEENQTLIFYKHRDLGLPIDFYGSARIRVN